MSSESLNDFKDLVSDIEDDELLAAAEGLLRDIIEIENMKERIQTLEGGLSKGDRAAFWFFAMGLDRDEIDMATNTVLGRKRILQDREERRRLQEQSEEPEENGAGSLLQI